MRCDLMSYIQRWNSLLSLVGTPRAGFNTGKALVKSCVHDLRL